MAAPEAVRRLIERFEEQHDSYTGDYNEAQVRREFIDPLFKALGWDIYNEEGLAEAYKDVIHEDLIREKGGLQAPDYCFRIGGTRKFFLEAKRPGIDIRNDPVPAFQLRRYAWSAKLSLSILTNFDYLAVYDCRVRPSAGDKASTARVLLLRYSEYDEKWPEVAGLFSKEAILKGAFDRYSVSKRLRGTATVDDVFLDEIEEWRKDLAQNIALRNGRIKSRELNFSVQQIIDRIIFLRICEDRGIEPYGRLEKLQQRPQVYQHLVELFREADDRYNSGLFHFRDERDQISEPDTLTPNLRIDDDTLKSILRNLYYPDSPYEFSVLPTEILGQVYERFLGKIIRLTTGHHARLEEKPEVRKAGGVYYTPEYIVDHIVKNTLGTRLEAKTPRQAQSVKIVDPACGSGSFLIGVYEYLLEWYRLKYVNDGPARYARGRAPVLYQGRLGGWRLTTAEKKRILMTHIYGVDIDPQAVEVTKLSLLLKLLEGETDENLKLFTERVLPDLGNNIKCGNSLVAPDFYSLRQLQMFDDEERYRVNVFDWSVAFPHILPVPGFDVVVGNPPWLMAGYYVQDSLDYLRRKFKSARGKFDLYYLFIEQGVQLLADGGSFGMIVPNKFFHTKAATELRRWLSGNKFVNAIVDFGDEQIFRDSTNYSCILFLRKSPQEVVRYASSRSGLGITATFDVEPQSLSASDWHFADERSRRLFLKVEAAGRPLGEMTARFGTGVQSGADRVLMLDTATATRDGLETALLRSVLRGRDVRRYTIGEDPKVLVFPYKVQEGEFVVLPETALREYGRVYRFLVRNKGVLTERVWFDKGPEELSGKWYGMMYLDSWRTFDAPHLLTPSLSDQANFALGKGQLFATGTAGVTSIVVASDVRENMRYLLGVLNSRVLSFYAIRHSPIFSGGFHKFSAPYLRKLPMRRIDFTVAEDVRQHDRIVELVQRMMDLQRDAHAARIPHERETLAREIQVTDQSIDETVASLYGLDAADRAFLETAS